MRDLSLIDAFEEYLKTEKGASENTRLSYLRDLRQFITYCGGFIAPEKVPSYILKLKSDGRSISTVSRNIASLKSFFMFACMRGYFEQNPTVELCSERIERKTPDILDYEEVELLLAQPQCIDLKGYRDKAMLELLYATGMRVSELIGLKVTDVDFTNNTITFGSSKKRTMGLSPAAMKALSEYTLFIRKQMVRNLHEEILFVNTNGDPMSRQGFWKILKGYQKRAGIKKNITPHTLRHSFAAHSLKNGSDLKSLQKTMGYSDVSAVGIYAEYAEYPIR